MLRKKSFIYGTLLFGLLFVVMWALMNPPQCPDNYTQAQVDASNCIVGANIGQPLFVGLLIVMSPALWLMCVAVIRRVPVRKSKLQK